MHGGGGEQEDKEEAWFGPGGESKADEEDMEPTVFDILSFSPGSDLSALFLGAGKERVFMGEPVAAVVARVEAVGRKGGYRVRRDGKRAMAPCGIRTALPCLLAPPYPGSGLAVVLGRRPPRRGLSTAARH